MKRSRLEGGGAAYFAGNPAGRKKYYGVKRMIAFQRKFPLSQYSYSPILRGSELSLQAYGPTWKTATPEQRAMRREYMMSGRGKYRGRGGYIGRTAGFLLGTAAGLGIAGGSAFASGGALAPMAPMVVPGTAAIGAAAGDQIEDAIRARFAGKGLYRPKMYSGRGEYATNNLIMDGGAMASAVVPVFNPSDIHTITYSNREFVRDIYAPASTASPFTVQTWYLNPGLVSAFPWLSQIALNFEEYEFIQLAFTYKSTVADFASASGQVGQVAIATQYNPNSDDFADKEEMMLYEGGMSCKTTESLIHGVECEPEKLAGAPQKYVRQGSLPPGEDLKNYDLGKTSLAVLNVPSTYAGQQIGELWVSYTVKLRKPKLVSANAYNVRRDYFTQYQPYQAALTVTNALLNIAGSQLLRGSRNSLGCKITWPTVPTATPTGPTYDNLIYETRDLTNGNVWSTQQQFSITFPPDYSGVVSIRVVLQTNAATNLVAITNNVSTILRFKDISTISPSATTAPYWSHKRATQDESSASSECELHLRILPAIGGADNVVIFTAVAPNGASISGGSLCWSRIEISQYNTLLSVQDNGMNDRIDLVNATTNQTASLFGT